MGGTQVKESTKYVSSTGWYGWDVTNFVRSQKSSGDNLVSFQVRGVESGNLPSGSQVYNMQHIGFYSVRTPPAPYLRVVYA